MSVLETSRKMTSREQTAYDLGFHEGRNAAIVHGRWIDKTEWIGSFGQIKTECSVCGTIYPHKPGSRGDGKGGKFCEECGARMDGAE